MSTVLNIGVDIAKTEIVVACAEGTWPVKILPNEKNALLAWLNTVPPGSRLGLEATGSYHERLADLAHARGLTVFLLNPKDTHHYAKAMGQRGKTDRVDARLIARLVAHEHTDLIPYTPPTAEQRRLTRLIQRRAKLVTVKGTLRQTLQGVADFQEDLNVLLQHLDQLIARIDAELNRVMTMRPERQAAHRRLQTLVGVGPLVAAGLLSLFERVPFARSDALIAFLGLDPRPKDSGQRVGRRRLSKRGPSELRRLLYNAALAASKTKLWKPWYDHYRGKGLSSTAALVVIARKIARIAFCLYRQNTSFDPSRLAIAA
jgi:transposase